jgi:hypothetical protein
MTTLPGRIVRVGDTSQLRLGDYYPALLDDWRAALPR